MYFIMYCLCIYLFRCDKLQLKWFDLTFATTFYQTDLCDQWCFGM